jgi:hypothetical protein
MSLSAQSAIQQALLLLGVYDPGETPSTSEQNQNLLILNSMLLGWFNEQAQSIAILLAAQNASGNMVIAEQKRAMTPLVTAFVLSAGTYTAPTYTAGTYAPATAPAFPDLTTPQTFPPGYEYAIVTGLAVNLVPQYGNSVTADPSALAMNAKVALAKANPVPGAVPVPAEGGEAAVPSPTDSTTQTP